MLFHSILTLFAVTFQAGKGLSAHTDTIADFDAFADFGSDSDGFADDFVADADSVFASQHSCRKTTTTTTEYLDVKSRE